MKQHWLKILLFIAGLSLSAIQPFDYFTWFLEITPAIVGLLILIFTYKSFRFTELTYFFILIHCYILFIGGHYTYAEVPIFNWIKDVFGQARNNYDKVGHFAQGFIPGLIARELFIRKQVVKKGFWLSLITVCVCLSVSVVYELGEWMVAVLTGASSEHFLGTQGYVWDTQSDMLYALIGVVCMLLFMSRIQDRSIARLEDRQSHEIR
jgi:putative membrane protein